MCTYILSQLFLHSLQNTDRVGEALSPKMEVYIYIYYRHFFLGFPDGLRSAAGIVRSFRWGDFPVLGKFDSELILPETKPASLPLKIGWLEDDPFLSFWVSAHFQERTVSCGEGFPLKNDGIGEYNDSLGR